MPQEWEGCEGQGCRRAQQAQPRLARPLALLVEASGSALEGSRWLGGCQGTQEQPPAQQPRSEWEPTQTKSSDTFKKHSTKHFFLLARLYCIFISAFLS